MIRFVDNEVEDIDHLTIDPYVEPQSTPSPTPSPVSSQTSVGIEMSEKISLDSAGGKIWRDPTPPIQPTHVQRFRQHLKSLKPHQVPRFFIYIKLFWVPLANGNNARPHTDRPHAFGRYEMIKRITDTRKLVTGLSRLLHGKHAVVGRMRKRARLLDFEGVEAYIGDLEGESCLPKCRSLARLLFRRDWKRADLNLAHLFNVWVTILLAGVGVGPLVSHFGLDFISCWNRANL
jgi:Mg2+ and Co2+ transporter CorA